MSDRGSNSLQRTIDFLLALAYADEASPPLPARIDYGAIVRLAAARGVATDETSVQAAFAAIIRARLLAAGRDAFRRGRSTPSMSPPS